MLARFLDFIDKGGELENAGGGGAKFGKLSLKPGGKTLVPPLLFVSTSRSSSLKGTLRLESKRLLLRFGVIVVL